MYSSHTHLPLPLGPSFSPRPNLPCVDHENSSGALAVLHHSPKWHMVAVQCDLQPVA